MGSVVLFTGLSGSGKTTLAQALCEQVPSAVFLDGDQLRQASIIPKGFSKSDRLTHLNEVSELTLPYLKEGKHVVCALIAPYSESRALFRQRVAPFRFIEVYLSTPLAICEYRDPKGLYKKARNKEITGFTGIDDPYEIPLNPDVTLDTSLLSVEECLTMLKINLGF